MSFTVKLSSDLISIEPGATIPLSVEVANRSESSDRYELEVEGIDPEWLAVPVPVFTIDRNDVLTEKIFLKPPRTSESLAGTYPFVVKVRSLESGDSRTAQGVLEIKSFHHLSMEVNPKKATLSAGKNQTDFQLTLVNLGNTEHQVQMYGSDAEDELAIEFDEEQIVIGPGQSKIVDSSVTPTTRKPIASARLFAVNFSARSTTTPNVACSGQSTLELRSLISPVGLFVVLFSILVFAGWIALLPKPPMIESLRLSNLTPVRGEAVTVTWKASNSKSVRVSLGDQILADQAQDSGSTTFIAASAGTITAVAIRDSKQSEVVTRSFTVREPTIAPDPEILLFDIKNRKIKLNDAFVIRYKLGPAVTKATLSPVGLILDRNTNEVQLTANIVGDVEYTLVAENADGKVTRKSITVNVFEASSASIVKFESNRTLLDEAGNVSITWQLNNAVRFELQNGSETILLDEATGTRELFIEKDTTLTLTGYDDQGRTVTKSIQIKIKPKPTIDPPSTTTTTTGGTTTGGGGIR